MHTADIVLPVGTGQSLQIQSPIVFLHCIVVLELISKFEQIGD